MSWPDVKKKKYIYIYIYHQKADAINWKVLSINKRFISSYQKRGLFQNTNYYRQFIHLLTTPRKYCSYSNKYLDQPYNFTSIMFCG